MLTNSARRDKQRGPTPRTNDAVLSMFKDSSSIDGDSLPFAFEYDGAARRLGGHAG